MAGRIPLLQLRNDSPIRRNRRGTQPSGTRKAPQAKASCSPPKSRCRCRWHHRSTPCRVQPEAYLPMRFTGTPSETKVDWSMSEPTNTLRGDLHKTLQQPDRLEAFYHEFKDDAPALPAGNSRSTSAFRPKESDRKAWLQYQANPPGLYRCGTDGTCLRREEARVSTTANRPSRTQRRQSLHFRESRRRHTTRRDTRPGCSSQTKRPRKSPT